MESVLIGLIPGVVISVIGFFIVRTLKDIEGKITKNELMIQTVDDKVERVEKEIGLQVNTLSKELAEHKETVQKDFVSKLEFARTTGEISKKLDKIQDYIMQLLKEGRRT